MRYVDQSRNEPPQPFSNEKGIEPYAASNEFEVDPMGKAFAEFFYHYYVEEQWCPSTGWSPIAAGTLARDAMLAEYASAKLCRRCAKEANEAALLTGGKERQEALKAAAAWEAAAQEHLHNLNLEGFLDQPSLPASGDEAVDADSVDWLE